MTIIINTSILLPELWGVPKMKVKDYYLNFFSQQHFEDLLKKFLLVFYLIFLTDGAVNAQWVQTTGLNGAFVWTLASIDSNIFIKH